MLMTRIISEALMDGTSMEMALKATIDLSTKKIDGKALALQRRLLWFM